MRACNEQSICEPFYCILCMRNHLRCAVAFRWCLPATRLHCIDTSLPAVLNYTHELNCHIGRWEYNHLDQPTWMWLTPTQLKPIAPSTTLSKTTQQLMISQSSMGQLSCATITPVSMIHSVRYSASSHAYLRFSTWNIWMPSLQPSTISRIAAMAHTRHVTFEISQIAATQPETGFKGSLLLSNTHL